MAAVWRAISLTVCDQWVSPTALAHRAALNEGTAVKIFCQLPVILVCMHVYSYTMYMHTSYGYRIARNFCGPKILRILRMNE